MRVLGSFVTGIQSRRPPFLGTHDRTNSIAHVRDRDGTAALRNSLPALVP